MLAARVLITVVLLDFTAAAAAELPRVAVDGRRYVELSRVADSLKTRLDATSVSTRAHLRAGAHVVTFTRNWSQIVLDGRPILLDAPVKVKRGTWLVPEAFVTRVLPRLTPAPSALPS